MRSATAKHPLAPKFVGSHCGSGEHDEHDDSGSQDSVEALAFHIRLGFAYGFTFGFAVTFTFEFRISILTRFRFWI